MAFLPGGEFEVVVGAHGQLSNTRSSIDREDSTSKGGLHRCQGRYECEQDRSCERGSGGREEQLCRGVRRRGVEGRAHGSCPTHCDRVEQPGRNHVAVANSDGRVGARRTEGQKASGRQPCRDNRGRKHGRWSYTVADVFWWARWTVTNMYCHPGQMLPHIIDDGVDYVVQKWTHPIMNEGCFISEWKAIESAHALAFKLQCPWPCAQATSSLKTDRPSRRTKPQRVTFDDLIEVRIGEEMQRSMFPHHALYHWPDKPWHSVDEMTAMAPEVFKMISRRPVPPTSWMPSLWIQPSGDASCTNC